MRNNWRGKRRRRKIADGADRLERVGYRTVLPRMDKWKARITELAEQYLEVAVREKLEKEKAAYAEGRSGAEADIPAGEDDVAVYGKDAPRDWTKVEEDIRRFAAKNNTLGYRSRAMRSIYVSMEPLERDEVKKRIAQVYAERDSEPVRRQ